MHGDSYWPSVSLFGVGLGVQDEGVTGCGAGYLAEMEAQSVKQAIQHHENEEHQQGSQVIQRHDPVIADVS